MLALLALSVLTATQPAPAAEPPRTARAQAQVLVRIIQAAEVRNGQTDAPHQRLVRTEDAGETLILLQFE